MKPNLLPFEDWTIGFDPEFFLKDKGGNLVPAYLSGIKGTKDRPQELDNGGMVQVDGMAIEINIPQLPINRVTVKEFLENINNTLSCVRSVIPFDFEFFCYPRAYFSTSMSRSLFSKTPDEFKALGCDPDFNAMTGAENPTPIMEELTRYAGGHIHFGIYENSDPKDPRSLIDACNMVQKINSSFRMDTFYYSDGDYHRAARYGWTSFRPKSYGFEFRGPSNTWLDWYVDPKKKNTSGYGAPSHKTNVYTTISSACDQIRRLVGAT